MSLHQEFVLLAWQEGYNRRGLCRRFGISPQTGYKWLARYVESEGAGLANRTRHPSYSPIRTEAELEQAVITLCQQHPAWGGCRISRHLTDLGWSDVSAPSTVISILHRYELTIPRASDTSTPWQHLEHTEPSQPRQIDLKGGFVLANGQRCLPLTMTDDHSHFSLVLAACMQTQNAVVQRHLRQVLKRYGLPLRINTDNGAPQGNPTRPGQLMGLGVWLVHFGVRLSYNRSAHLQINGKNECFHRTFKAEVLAGRYPASCDAVQHALDAWCIVYDCERPHQTTDLATPITRYQPSPRPCPPTLVPIEYSPQDIILNAGRDGELCFRSWRLKFSNTLYGLSAVLRPDPKHRD